MPDHISWLHTYVTCQKEHGAVQVGQARRKQVKIGEAISDILK